MLHDVVPNYLDRALPRRQRRIRVRQREEDLYQLTGGLPVSPAGLQIAERHSDVRVKLCEFFVGECLASLVEPPERLGEIL